MLYNLNHFVKHDCGKQMRPDLEARPYQELAPIRSLPLSGARPFQERAPLAQVRMLAWTVR